MLADLLPAEIFGFLLVFARLGAILMLLPGFGEITVSPRLRLAMGLAIAFLLYPVLRPSLPVMPDGAFALALLLGGEIVIGLAIGTLARLMLYALHVAGSVIAFQIGLGFAQAYDPGQGTQSALFATFLTLLGLVLIFATDLHLAMLMALRRSYVLFVPGLLAAPADFAALVVTGVSRAFLLGVQIAMPFLVFGTVFQIGLGLLARLMPQIQIFFIAMPAQILLGFAVLMLVLGAAMMWFLAGFEDALRPFAA